MIPILAMIHILAVVHILCLASSNIGSFGEIVESASSCPRETVVRLGLGRGHVRSRPFQEEMTPLRDSIISEAALLEGHDQEDSAHGAKTRRELQRQRFSTSLTSASPSNVTERCEKISNLYYSIFGPFSRPHMLLPFVSHVRK